MINLGELAKPVTVFIEKISDAIGGIAKPWQITRVAEAEGKAEVARAKAHIEISELEERALQRMVREEGRKQENIEAITQKAVSQLREDAKPEDLDADWLVHLFEKGRLVSDEEMQQYWAAMLAGEANSPGKFSKRTIDLIASMDKQDVRLFNRFCSCIWTIESKVPVIFDFPVKEDFRLSFEMHQHLESLGLIHIHTGLGGYAIGDLGSPTELEAIYFDTKIVLNPIENSLEVGNALLTSAGTQIFSLCAPSFVQDCIDSAVMHWIEQGHLPRSRISV